MKKFGFFWKFFLLQILSVPENSPGKSLFSGVSGASVRDQSKKIEMKNYFQIKPSFFTTRNMILFRFFQADFYEIYFPRSYFFSNFTIIWHKMPRIPNFSGSKSLIFIKTSLPSHRSISATTWSWKTNLICRHISISSRLRIFQPEFVKMKPLSVRNQNKREYFAILAAQWSAPP